MKQKEKEDATVYHNTELLLKHYRDVVWSLEVSVNRINRNFYQEYGRDIEGFLELTYEAGLDLNGTEIESQTKTIARSRNMLRMIDCSVDLLRTKHKNGELYYWILYYTYLSPQEMQNIDEIVDKLRDYMKDVSRSTYFRKKNEAVMQLGRVLWGYTSRECMEIVSFFENNKGYVTTNS